MLGEKVLRTLVANEGLISVPDVEADRVRSRGPLKEGSREEMAELEGVMPRVLPLTPLPLLPFPASLPLLPSAIYEVK